MFSPPCAHPSSMLSCLSCRWESLDGSRVLTHFPPADTYNSQCTVEEMVSSVKRFKDKERSQFSLYVFGHGDGGGGPTEEMIERLRRLQNINGMCRMTFLMLQLCGQKNNAQCWRFIMSYLQDCRR